MSVVMRELTSGILRHCKVLYFSWDMPTFEPKTSAMGGIQEQCVDFAARQARAFHAGVRSEVSGVQYDSTVGKLEKDHGSTWTVIGIQQNHLDAVHDTLGVHRQLTDVLLLHSKLLLQQIACYLAAIDWPCEVLGQPGVMIRMEMCEEVGGAAFDLTVLKSIHSEASPGDSLIERTCSSHFPCTRGL